MKKISKCLNFVCAVQWRASRALALVMALCAALFSPVVLGESHAQQATVVSDEMIQSALDGDAYSAFIVGRDFLVKGGEENVRNSIKFLQIAFEGYAIAEGDEERWSASVLKMLGDGFSQLSNYAAAIDNYETAQKILGRFTHVEGVPLERALMFQAQGVALLDLSRYEDSLVYFEAARAGMIAADGENSPWLGDTYLNEGIALEGLNKFQKSVEVYQEAMLRYGDAYGLESAQAAYAISNLGWVFRRMENFGEAERWTLRALPLIEKFEGAFSDNASKVRINLGIISLQLRKYDDAVRWTMRAMPYMSANRSTTFDDQRWAFDTLSRAMKAKGDVGKAITFGKLAVNAQQAIRSQNTELGDAGTKELRSEWSRLYENLASLLIEEGRISEAQSVLNMEKEQEVFDFLRRDASVDINNTTAVLTNAELSDEEKLQALAKFPVEAAKELFELTAKLANDTASDAELEQVFLLQEVLEQSSQAFDLQVEAFLETVTPTEVKGLSDQFGKIDSYQALLEGREQKAAILQVAAINDKVHLFLTLENLNLHFEVEVPKGELAQLVFDSLQQIEQRAPDTKEKLNALYDILFAPVHEALETSEIEVVMLNLNGFLRYVPFSALYDGEEYLIQNFAFSLYSAAIPTQFDAGKRERSRTVGFGVTEAHPGFSPLPGVKKELEAIFSGEDKEGILEGPTSLDSNFDERSLKLALLKKPSILHIASHFNLKPGREDESFLLMGDGSHLLLSEIRSKRALSFKGIDLVTLSACQTALGSGDGSEIDGFGAAAQANGAAAVMASLWPVADDATPILMRNFYHALIDQGLTKAEALRVAQVSMLTGVESTIIAANIERGVKSRQKKKANRTAEQVTFAHPFFWSPFVLMGNWL